MPLSEQDEKKPEEQDAAPAPQVVTGQDQFFSGSGAPNADVPEVTDSARPAVPAEGAPAESLALPSEAEGQGQDAVKPAAGPAADDAAPPAQPAAEPPVDAANNPRKILDELEKEYQEEKEQQSAVPPPKENFSGDSSEPSLATAMDDGLISEAMQQLDELIKKIKAQQL